VRDEKLKVVLEDLIMAMVGTLRLDCLQCTRRFESGDATDPFAECKGSHRVLLDVAADAG
jgi:hypothetical protein